jgi:hypothetical protein
MTTNEKAKEKAKELWCKMYNVDDPMGKYPMCHDTAKQCALIVVDELRDNLPLITDVQNYWRDVKNEIEKL